MYNNAFAKVENSSLRQKIFQQMAQSSVEIQIQLQDNSLVNIKSYKKTMDELHIYRELPNQPDSQEVIVSWNIPPERYFLKSTLTRVDNIWCLQLTQLLYKLQRRKNFRLSLPRLWDARFECLLQNVTVINKTFVLYDLSGSGFSFEYSPSDEFKIIPDAELEGSLKVRNRIDIKLKAKVRHYKECGTKGYPRVRVGLEILNLRTEEESKIMSVLMEVHREIFSRLK